MLDKHVDDLVRAHQQKRHELQALGDEIKQSARPVVVCFRFPMKGFPEPEEVFLRQPTGTGSEYAKSAVA